MSLTVAKLAGRAGVGPDTVRYYERAGLLPEPERSAAGYRQYGEDLVERLRFIKGAQRTGLKIRQIRGLLEVMDRGVCPCGHTEKLLARRIAEIDAEIGELGRMRERLTELQHDLPSRAAEDWPCRDAFIEVGSKPSNGGNADGKATG